MATIDCVAGIVLTAPAASEGELSCITSAVKPDLHSH